VRRCEDTTYSALLSCGARDIEVVQKQHEKLAPVCKRLGGGNGCVHCAPARAVCTASYDLHQQRARVQRERGYIITAIGKRSSLRCDGSATAGGCFRVGCHGDTLGPLPRGCSLEYPPSCLFSAIPSSPSLNHLFPLSRLLSLSLSLYFSLLYHCHRSHRLRFSPPYTYVFTRPPSLPTTLLIALAGPFASFVPRLTPFQRRQRWLALASLLFFPSPTSNRASSTTRFYFVTVSLIPVLCRTALYIVSLLRYCCAITIDNA